MRLAVGCALMLTLGAESARAAVPPVSDACNGPSIVLEPPLSERRSWRAAAGNTKKRVAELADVDACTRLEVEQSEGTVRVRASAADGRSVVRDLSSPAELEPTVVALLVLPPSERSDASSETASGSEQAAAASGAAATPRKPDHAATPQPKLQTSVAPATTAAGDATSSIGSAADGARTRGFELALAGSGRAAGYLTGAGASALVDWRFGRWLVGAALHGEQVTGPSDAAGRFSAVRNFSAAALFGRRLVARPFYLDAALELPIVAVSTGKWTSEQQVTTPGAGTTTENEPGESETGETDDTASGAPTAPTTSTRTSAQATPPLADLRAGALVRGVVPFARRFGAVLALDAEHSLGILKPPKTNGQPPPLGFNFGVSLGLFWSAP